MSEAILKIKNEATDPYLFVGGNFNNRDIEEAIGDYPDLAMAQSGATRGSRPQIMIKSWRKLTGPKKYQTTLTSTQRRE